MKSAWDWVGFVAAIPVLFGVAACAGAVDDPAARAAAGAATAHDVLKRASFDLNCSEREIEMRWFDYRTAGVSGCGRRGTYVQTCERAKKGFSLDSDAQRGCTWVLNNALSSASSTAPSASSAPPAP